MVAEARRRRFHLVPERSAVVVEARSNVGPILFGAAGLAGEIEVAVAGSRVEGPGARARVEVRVDQLASGNDLYDSELRQRIDARRYPRSIVDLRDAEAVEGTGSFRVSGDITFHGVTRAMSGDVAVNLGEDGRIVVSGEEEVDIRAFGLSPPTMLMLRIRPEVRICLHLEAEAEADVG